MKFEEVIQELGEFGPYQKKLYFLICLVGFPSALQTLAGVFTMATPDHRCALPDLPNDTYKSQGEWHDQMLKSRVPWDGDEDEYERCSLFKEGNANETVSCDKWVYSKDPFETTIVMDLDLVCGDKQMVTYASMILMSGMLAGSLIMGAVSDLIGRKKVMVGCAIAQFGVGLGVSFVKNYMAYVVLRFLSMFFGMGMFLAAFVVGMELVGASYRRVAGIVIEMFWCLGLFLQSGIAYGIRDWTTFSIVMSIPCIVVFGVFLWLVPESPRWLINKGRISEASEIIRKAAAGNGVQLSEKTLSLQDIELEGEGEKIWHMFTTPVLLIRSLVILSNWLVASLVYYGLSLNAGNLSGDIYLNFFLLAVVEMASYIFCLLTLDKLGRKFLQCFSMLLSGVACVATMFPVIWGGESEEWITLVLSLIGKFGASAGFAVIYIFSAELFPTVMRNSGMGLSSFSARIGSIAAPFIGDLSDMVSGDFGIALPLIIFGGASITVGLLALLLPETMGRVLPDTVEDAKNFGRSSKKSSSSAYEMRDANDLPSKEKNGVTNLAFVQN